MIDPKIVHTAKHHETPKEHVQTMMRHPLLTVEYVSFSKVVSMYHYLMYLLWSILSTSNSIVSVHKNFNVITMVHTKYIKHGVCKFLSFLKLLQKVFLNFPLICARLTIYG